MEKILANIDPNHQGLRRREIVRQAHLPEALENFGHQARLVIEAKA